MQDLCKKSLTFCYRRIITEIQEFRLESQIHIGISRPARGSRDSLWNTNIRTEIQGSTLKYQDSHCHPTMQITVPQFLRESTARVWENPQKNSKWTLNRVPKESSAGFRENTQQDSVRVLIRIPRESSSGFRENHKQNPERILQDLESILRRILI